MVGHKSEREGHHKNREALQEEIEDMMTAPLEREILDADEQQPFWNVDILFDIHHTCPLKRKLVAHPIKLPMMIRRVVAPFQRFVIATTASSFFSVSSCLIMIVLMLAPISPISRCVSASTCIAPIPYFFNLPRH